ncbi:putative F-box/kelch-repeat protein At1g15680 [Nicotiana tomentosiformis]|uniref:putative F-box/kelch-repeat protein At1g15680 n=1 Tax=Nicotiana tomentosiformis TaxID=4098 RepID=UPI00051C0BA8|nr:uncharacterized protein LOC104116766 [Nicotiana tomentosiformis]
MLSNLTLPCHGLDLKRKASEFLIPCHSNEQTETNVLLTPHVLSLNNLDNLVEELLIEIVVRLSSKAAIRCKTVCKRWCSLISVSILNHHHLVFKRRHWCINIEYCFPRQQSRGLSFLPFPKPDVRLLATSADLMLCCQDNKDLSCSINFYVVNLLTEQWIDLPPAPPGLLVDSTVTGFICKPHYQNTNTNFRFRIVRIPDDYSKIPSSEIKIQVFSSEKGEWKWFNVSLPLMLKHCGFRHIFVYDPFCDPLRFSRVIDLPAKLSGTDCYRASQGHLCVARLTGKRDPDRRKNASVSVWELEKYNMGRWCLRQSQDISQTAFLYRDSTRDLLLPNSIPKLPYQNISFPSS